MDIRDLQRQNEIVNENRELRRTNETLRDHLEYAALNGRYHLSELARLRAENETIRQRCAIAEASIAVSFDPGCSLQTTTRESILGRE